MTSAHVLLYDFGRFPSWAQTLTRYFTDVSYYNPWMEAFPTARKSFVDGVEGVNKVMKFWDAVPDIDLFIFPDIYMGDLQEHLVAEGHSVWGCRSGDELEINRHEFKRLLKRLDLPVTPYVRIFGMDQLKSYLQTKSDVFVKINLWRGDMETWHHENYDLSEPLLEKLSTRFGARGCDMEFIVETPTSRAVEVGYDGWCLDGVFPTVGIQGFEVKDSVLVAAVQDYGDLPEPVRYINERLADSLKGYGYRGFWSTEIRVTADGQPYLIDPCCRCGSPPSELYQELYDNWDEIFLGGAAGDIVLPRATAPFGVQVSLKSDWAERNWQAVRFPDSISQFVKLTSFSRIGGAFEVAPQDAELTEIGSVVATGTTLLDAIKTVKERCELVKGFRIKPCLDALYDANQTLLDAKDFGIEFPGTPTLKEVATVLA